MSALLKPKFDYYTLEEYYALETGSDRRFEYWEGEIVCMSGGSPEHGIITGNINGLLYNIFVSKSCQTFSEGQAIKVNITASGYVYSDASAACNPEFETHTERGIGLLTNPVLIVEVASPESSIRDYNRKKDGYQVIPTLRDYLVIEPDEVHVTHYRLIDGKWKKRVYEDINDIIQLVSTDATIEVKHIYNGV